MQKMYGFAQTPCSYSYVFQPCKVAEAPQLVTENYILHGYALITFQHSAVCMMKICGMHMHAIMPSHHDLITVYLNTLFFTY